MAVATASTNNPRTAESDVESNSSLILATWSLADKTKVQTRIGALDKNAQERVGSSGNYRLMIKNTKTGETIFEQRSDDTPVSMYTRDLNADWNDELIITWGGGSADRLEVLSVDPRGASIVLNQSYRVDASLIDLSGRGKIDIFIVTAESGAKPSYVTRYAWQGREYSAVDRVNYDLFVRTIARLTTRSS